METDLDKYKDFSAGTG